MTLIKRIFILGALLSVFIKAGIADEIKVNYFYRETSPIKQSAGFESKPPSYNTLRSRFGNFSDQPSWVSVNIKSQKTGERINIVIPSDEWLRIFTANIKQLPDKSSYIEYMAENSKKEFLIPEKVFAALSKFKTTGRFEKEQASNWSAVKAKYALEDSAPFLIPFSAENEKRDFIAWLLSFNTDIVKLPRNRIYITYYDPLAVSYDKNYAQRISRSWNNFDELVPSYVLVKVISNKTGQSMKIVLDNYKWFNIMTELSSTNTNNFRKIYINKMSSGLKDGITIPHLLYKNLTKYIAYDYFGYDSICGIEHVSDKYLDFVKQGMILYRSYHPQKEGVYSIKYGGECFIPNELSAAFAFSENPPVLRSFVRMLIEQGMRVDHLNPAYVGSEHIKDTKIAIIVR